MLLWFLFAQLFFVCKYFSSVTGRERNGWSLWILPRAKEAETSAPALFLLCSSPSLPGGRRTPFPYVHSVVDIGKEQGHGERTPLPQELILELKDCSIPWTTHRSLGFSQKMCKQNIFQRKRIEVKGRKRPWSTLEQEYGWYNSSVSRLLKAQNKERVGNSVKSEKAQQSSHPMKTLQAALPGCCVFLGCACVLLSLVCNQPWSWEVPWANLSRIVFQF